MHCYDAVVDTISFKAFEKGVEFAYLIDDNVPTFLRGDPGRLRQILTNLVGNAIKFVSEGEVFIRVSLEKEEQKHVKLLFEIIDTGIGIPEKIKWTLCLIHLPRLMHQQQGNMEEVDWGLLFPDS